MTELEEAAQEFDAAKRVMNAARDRLASEIVKAAKTGVRQVEIVKVTGYTRENVRRICRLAGLESE